MAARAGGTKRRGRKPAIQWPDSVSQLELARLLGITGPGVGKVVKAGFLKKTADGKRLELIPSLRGYVDYKVEQATRRFSRETPTDRLAAKREQQLDRKLAIEDRQIIDLSEALDVYDEIVGLFLTTLGGLPARLTRNLEERERIEQVIDTAQGQLAQKFGEKRVRLQAGTEPADPEEEADV